MSKVFIIEGKSAEVTTAEPDPKWHQWHPDTFLEESEAIKAYEEQAYLYGHDTYLRLVKVKRKILREC